MACYFLTYNRNIHDRGWVEIGFGGSDTVWVIDLSKFRHPLSGWVFDICYAECTNLDQVGL